MIARVLEGEIDAVRMSVEEAVNVVRGSVVPALRAQEGYGGMYLLVTDEGKTLAVSLWTTEAAAEAGTRRQSSAVRRPDREIRLDPVARRTASRLPTRLVTTGLRFDSPTPA
jgi:heme-degrading monooxygenase HmoA